MRKLKDWVPRLERTFKEAKFKTFDVREFNCCTFAADCVEAQIGIDPIKDWRHEFKNVRTACRFFKNLAGSSFMTAAYQVAANIGAKEIRPTYVQRGDVVIAENEAKEEIFAVIDLSARWVIGVRPDKGLQAEPLSVIKRAWRIG